MVAPSTAITRLDLSISYGEFSLAANQAKYVGLRVLPPLAVAQEAADFAKINLESVLTKVEETVRNPKSSYKRDDWTWGKDSYALAEHGVEEVIDDATIERYGDVLRAEMISAQRAANRVLQRLEYDIAAAVFNTTTWTGSELTTAVGTAWTTKASADPIANIDAAHDKVNAGCGEDANTLVLTKKAFRAMLRTARLEALLQYDSSQLLFALNNGQNQSMVQQVMSGLHDLLQVERIIVARGFKNTADLNQTASLSRLWDDTKAMLCVVRDDGLEGDLESPRPQIGRVLFSSKNDEPVPGSMDSGIGSLIMEEYREEGTRGSVLRARNKYQVKILHPECGHLLTNVTA